MGPCSPLVLTPLGPEKLYRLLIYTSVLATRAAQQRGWASTHSTPMSIPPGWIGDTAGVAAKAMSTLSTHAGGRVLLVRVHKVALTVGAKPGVGVRGGILSITIVPAQGFAGRPSSARIVRALEGK